MNGRKFPHGNFWVAYVATKRPGARLGLFRAARAWTTLPWDVDEDVESFTVVKPSCTIVAIREREFKPGSTPVTHFLRARIDTLLRTLDDADRASISVGIAKGYCEQWPTPLLEQDVIGPAITAAARTWQTAEAGARVIGVSALNSVELVRTLAGEERDVEVRVNIKPDRFNSRTAIFVSDAAVKPWGFERASHPTDAPTGDRKNDTKDEHQIRSVQAFAITADIIGSSRMIESLHEVRDEYKTRLTQLRRVLREHIPALLALSGVQSSDEGVDLSTRMFFEFTGDGFFLVLYAANDSGVLEADACLDWLFTLALDLSQRDVPLRIAASRGLQDCYTMLVDDRRWKLPVDVGGASPFAWARDVCDGFKLRLPAADGAPPEEPPPEVPALFLHPMLTRALNRSGTPDDVAAAELERLGLRRLAELGPDVPGHAVACSAMAAPMRRLEKLSSRPISTFKDVSITSRGLHADDVLAQRTVTTGLDDAARKLRHRAVWEALLTGLAALSLAEFNGWIRWGLWLAAVVAAALVFGSLAAFYFRRYMTVRLLPTLPRPQFRGKLRERLYRSSLRLFFGLSRPTVSERKAAAYAETGLAGRVFWSDHIRRGLTAKDKDLPEARHRWPTAWMAIVGIVAYAVIIVASTRFPLAFEQVRVWPCIIGFVIVGIAWNACAYWRVRRIPLYLLYFGRPRHDTDYRLLDTHRRGRELDYVNGNVHLALVLALGVGYGLHVGSAPHGAVVIVGLIVAGGSGIDSMAHLRQLRRASEGWSTLYDAGRLSADGADLFAFRDGNQTRQELIPLDPALSTMHLMVARGDLLRNAMQALPQLLASCKSTAGVGWFVATQHGDLLASQGDLLRDLGWTTPPDRVASYFADGTFADKVVRQFSRYAGPRTCLDMETICAGPALPIEQAIRMQTRPVRLRVLSVNVEMIAAGYLAVMEALPQSQARWYSAHFDD